MMVFPVHPREAPEDLPALFVERVVYFFTFDLVGGEPS
jgi:hypothetical protein